MKVHTLTLNPSVDRLLVVPGFVPGGHLRAQRVSLTPAGKGINVARYLRILGEESTVWALVGKREMTLYRDNLHRSGIRTRLYAVRGNTRQNVTIIDPENGETHIREPGFQVASREMELLLKDLRPASSRGDIIALSGSLPLGLSGKHLVSMVKTLPERNFLFDVNHAALQLDRFPPLSNITLKINATEFRELAEAEASVESATGFMARFPSLKNVIVTDGMKETLWVGAEETLSALPPKVEVKNTVGAGDAFLAGFISAFSAGRGPDRCLRKAIAAGSASVLEQAVGTLNPEALAELEGKVKIKRLACKKT